MNNKEKFKTLIQEVFLIEASEFRFDLSRDEIETWDSLGVVSLAVGVEETFGYHMSPAEAIGLKGLRDLVQLLECRNISFDHDA